MDGEKTDYSGSETTGFQPPSQDYIEHVIDLARVLDLQSQAPVPRYTTRLDELVTVRS